MNVKWVNWCNSLNTFIVWCASESPGKFMQNMYVVGSAEVEETMPPRAPNYIWGDGGSV